MCPAHFSHANSEHAVSCPAHFSHGTTKAFPTSSFNFFHGQVFLISSNGTIWGSSRILNVLCPHCSQTSTHVKKCSSHWTWKQTWPTRSPPSDFIRTTSFLLMSKCFKPNAEYEQFTCCKSRPKWIVIALIKSCSAGLGFSRLTFNESMGSNSWR